MLFAQLGRRTGMPHYSALFGLGLTGLWLLVYVGGPLLGRFGPFRFDSAELPVVTLYGGYIPVFIQMMRRERDLGYGKRFILPGLSIVGCIFMVVAAVIGHGIDMAWYLLIFFLITALGSWFLHKKREESD